MDITTSRNSEMGWQSGQQSTVSFVWDGPHVRAAGRVVANAIATAAASLLTPVAVEILVNGPLIAAADISKSSVPVVAGIVGVFVLATFAGNLIESIGALADTCGSRAFWNLTRSDFFESTGKVLTLGASCLIGCCGQLVLGNLVYTVLLNSGLKASSYGGSQVPIWILIAVVVLTVVGSATMALAKHGVLRHAGFGLTLLVSFIIFVFLPVIAFVGYYILKAVLFVGQLVIGLYIGICLIPLMFCGIWAAWK